MSKTMEYCLLAVIAAGTGIGGYFWLEHYKTPTIRAGVTAPLYTVGGSDYVRAMNRGKKVIEFGPLPGSAFYAGAVAFRTPKEAQQWLVETGKSAQGWRVYETSGDFELDTHLVRGLAYTNKSLLVSREVAVEGE